jgi:hypothetical protein
MAMLRPLSKTHFLIVFLVLAYSEWGSSVEPNHYSLWDHYYSYSKNVFNDSQKNL